TISAVNPTESTVSLSDLVALLRNPAAVFFDKHLGVVFNNEELTGDDHEAFAVDGLHKWQIQDQLIRDAQRLLRTQVDNTSVDMPGILDQLINKQQRQGVLPLPPFADLYRDPLTRALIKPLQRYHDLMRHSAETGTRLVQATSADGSLTLEDTLNDVRQTDDGAYIRCAMLSSQIWSGKTPGGHKAASTIKWHYLARHWPAHVAAQLHGPVKTHVLGPDTDEILAPLDLDTAQHVLQTLLSLYQQNLTHPLAAEVKTSCAYLTTDPEKSPLDAARSVYEGTYTVSGAMQSSEALSRLWPDFDTLMQGQLPEQTTELVSDADHPAFVSSSTDLYHAMVEHWTRHRQRNNTDGEDAE
ncbi:MAG: hypothetical protein WD600_10375, partial [Pseudohongiella sp.]